MLHKRQINSLLNNCQNTYSYHYIIGACVYYNMLIEYKNITHILVELRLVYCYGPLAQLVERLDLTAKRLGSYPNAKLL